MINFKVGNLFENFPSDKTVIIAHVCNDVGGWGSGFVVPLSKKFPLAEGAYRKWYASAEINMPPPDRFELGRFQIVDVSTNKSIFVANMIAQHSTITRSPGTTPLRYWALCKCLRGVGEVARSIHQTSDNNVELYCPMFGSGLAGGKWDIIETLIEESWEGIPTTVYKLE